MKEIDLDYKTNFKEIKEINREIKSLIIEQRRLNWIIFIIFFNRYSNNSKSIKSLKKQV